MTKAAIGNFPEPKNYSSFVYYREDDAKPVIANGRNRASPEMLYVTASDGATFEKRAKELKTGDGLLEQIASHANAD